MLKESMKLKADKIEVESLRQYVDQQDEKQHKAWI
jgi:hypothetical protein